MLASMVGSLRPLVYPFPVTQGRLLLLYINRTLMILIIWVTELALKLGKIPKHAHIMKFSELNGMFRRKGT